MSINYITTYGLCLDILFFPLHSCTLILSQNLFHSTQIHSATKNIDKSVYVLEKFLVHRARSRRPKGASY